MTVRRNLLASLTLVTMEALVLFALATALARASGDDGPNFLTVLLAALGGFGLSRGLQMFDLNLRTGAVVGGAVTVLALLVLLNIQYNLDSGPFALGWFGELVNHPQGFLAPRWPQAWGVFLVVGAWFRGVWLAQRDLTYTLALGSFSTGALIIVLLLLFGQSSRSEDALNATALPFFVCGLLTLALLELRRAGPDASRLRGPWLGVLGGTVVAIGLVSGLLGLFPLGLFNRLLAPVGRVALLLLDAVIYAISIPIGYALTWILNLLIRNREDRQIEPPRQAVSEAAEQLQRRSQDNLFLDALLTLGKVAFGLLLVAVIGFVLYRTFRRLRRPVTDLDETRESLGHEGSLAGDLAALWKGLLGRMQRPEAREPALPPDVLRVRRLYMRVLERAADGGVSRPSPATPDEFAPRLTQHFGTAVPAEVTERFVAARYGRIAPDEREISALERRVRDGLTPEA